MNWFRKSSKDYRFPLQRFSDRQLPSDFSGYVYTWDVDNTYIRTDLKSLRAMLTLPFEMAVDKKPFPAVAALMREIRRGPGSSSRETPLFFISASPVQMKKVLEARMLLDGIQHDGITLRDWGKLLRGGNLTKLKHPIGYKLSALLLNRRDYPNEAKELLFGDDTESDAVIYSLYADILSGRLRDAALERALWKVPKEDARYVMSLTEGLPELDAVEAILIHRVRRKPRLDFQSFGPRLCSIQDYLQASLHLLQLGQISLDGLSRVAIQAREQGLDIEKSFVAALEGGLLSLEQASQAAHAIDCKEPETPFEPRLRKELEGGFYTPPSLRGAQVET